jgi:DNA-binding NarL/FixJ family response regulator
VNKSLLVYIADDHSLVANGLAGLLNNLPIVKEVKVFNDGKPLFEACLIETPGFIFLDIEMPIWDGRKTLSELKKTFPTIPCVILSMLNEKAIIEDCINKGAVGYLNKDCSILELEEAINSKEIYFSKEVLKTLSGYGKQTGNTNFSLIDPLTERELEVLTLLCDGYSPKEIGDKIHLSHRTVETHKTAIMQKFDVNSVGKLISIALKNKIV